MYECFKCKKLVKPASLAVHVGGEPHHPHCVSCVICDRPLFGANFKKNKKGYLQCEEECKPKSNQLTPNMRPNSDVEKLTNNSQLNRVVSSKSNPVGMYGRTPIGNHDGRMQSANFDTSHFGNKTCKSCNQSVVGRRFMTYENGDVLCYDCDSRAALRLPRIRSAHLIICSLCNDTLKGRRYITNSNGKILCDKCEELMFYNRPINNEIYFKCNQCGDSISSQSGYFKNPITNMPICLKCHLPNTATKCAKCAKVIEKDGRTFADKDYHLQCFRCRHCNIELFKMKRTYCGRTSDEIMCEPCFTQIYAPKCAKCLQPISPQLQVTKYEDKMYHSECFTCGRCKKTVANRKFYRVGNMLICENCY